MKNSHNNSNKKLEDSDPALSLDLSEEALKELATQSLALITDYFTQVAKNPLFEYTSASEFADRFNSELSLEGESLEKLMADCRSIFEATRHTGHPRFLGYIGSVSTPVGAFADLIASSLNPNVNSWRGAPAATELEKIVVGWLGSLIGYGENSQGFLTSGGSMANLNALVMAHRVQSPERVSEIGLWNLTPMMIYAGERAHFSISKAADIMGLGRNCVRTVSSDANFRLDISSLRQCIETDLAKGLRPFCVVANAGSTSTGTVDSLAEIASVAEEYNLWFHVDGAYGAPAALDPRKCFLFEGIERADSVAIDAHKWLFTPIDCGCLLFRKSDQIRDSLSFGIGDYLKLHEETEAESFAFWDYSIELSRRFRALKIWMLLRYYGVERIRGAICENNALAEYFAECVNTAKDFELLAPVELSICCFRYVPSSWAAKFAVADETQRETLNAELNQLNAKILYAVQRNGKAYLSNTTISGKYALRACMVNFRTTRADIDQVLELVRQEFFNLNYSGSSIINN